jgi:exodeoxyribonuclease V alpha subunit
MNCTAGDNTGSRGKKLVVVVGTKKALAMAVKRQDTSRRYTALRKRLRDG